MSKSKYPHSASERSVRMVMEARSEHSSQWTMIESIAGKLAVLGDLTSLGAST